MSKQSQATQQKTTAKRKLSRSNVLCALSILLFACVFWSLNSGAVETTLSDVFAAFSFGESSAKSQLKSLVINEIRLPRILLAFLVGAALTLSGSLLQGLFRNPLADPALIGVSSGGAMGAVTAIVLLPVIVIRLKLPEGATQIIQSFGLPIFAMCGAIALTFIIYRVSLVRGHTHVPAMLLTGIAVNAIGGAFVGLVVTVFATDEQLRTITFWTLGSLSGSNWDNTIILAIFIIIPALVALRQDRALNAFLLGEAEAFHLGVDTQSVKRTVILISATMVGATVAFCGIIGFVGLVVPHMLRTVLGPDHRLLLPAGILLGAIALIIADIFARTLMSPAELQLGILTAIIGGPFFLALLIRSRSGRDNSLSL